MNAEAKRSRLVNLAERAASHPRIERAVVSAIRTELPGVIRELLEEMADHEGGTLRLYRNKRPQRDRQVRDDRVRTLLAAGASPEVAAAEVGCSRRHAYTLRLQMQAKCKTPP